MVRIIVILLLMAISSGCVGRDVYTLTCARGDGDFNPFTANGQLGAVGTPKDAEVKIVTAVTRDTCELSVVTLERED